METENIELPKQMLDNIRSLIKNTRMFADEKDFIEQAIIKQMSKLKNA